MMMLQFDEVHKAKFPLFMTSFINPGWSSNLSLRRFSSNTFSIALLPRYFVRFFCQGISMNKPNKQNRAIPVSRKPEFRRFL